MKTFLYNATLLDIQNKELLRNSHLWFFKKIYKINNYLGI